MLQAASVSLTPGRFLQVGTLQMHGTGTALGDPIEVNAALAVLLTNPKTRAAAAGVRCILQHMQRHFVPVSLMHTIVDFVVCRLRLRSPATYAWQNLDCDAVQSCCHAIQIL